MGRLSNIGPYKAGEIPSLLQKWLDILYDALRGHVIASTFKLSTGCIPSNGTDATNDIDFSLGVQRDSTNVYTIDAAAVMTKRADATWAAGTGNGGMAQGLTFSTTTDYHLFLLGKTSDPSAYDYIFDTSLTCVNGLADDAVEAAGFTLYKRVSTLRTGGSAAWPLITARESAIGQVEYLLKTPTFELNKDWAGADDTAQTGTLALVPGGIQVNAILGVMFQDTSAGAASALLVSAIDQTDTAASNAAASWVGTFKLASTGGNAFASGIVQVRTSTSRTFRYRAQNSTIDHDASFCTIGWEDSRL